MIAGRAQNLMARGAPTCPLARTRYSAASVAGGLDSRGLLRPGMCAAPTLAGGGSRPIGSKSSGTDRIEGRATVGGVASSLTSSSRIIAAALDGLEIGRPDGHAANMAAIDAKASKHFSEPPYSTRNSPRFLVPAGWRAAKLRAAPWGGGPRLPAGEEVRPSSNFRCQRTWCGVSGEKGVVSVVLRGSFRRTHPTDAFRSPGNHWPPAPGGW